MADFLDEDKLFDEFEKSRPNVFVKYDSDKAGVINKSRILFETADSDTEISEDDDDLTKNDLTKRNPRFTDLTVQSKKQDDSNDEKICNNDEAIYGKHMAEDVLQLIEDKQMQIAGEHNNECIGVEQTTYQKHFQNSKYKPFIRLIDSTRCAPDNQGPALQIIFHNNKFARKNRNCLEQFVINLLNYSDMKDLNKSAFDLSSKPSAAMTCVDISEQVPPERRSVSMWHAHGIIGCAQFHKDFMVDCRGWPLDLQEPTMAESTDMPKYVQIFNDAYPPHPDKPLAATTSTPMHKGCFNCDGNHHLNSCQIARNEEKIRARRRQVEKAASKRGQPRYHKDPELDPTRASFAPGRISDGLRAALGLKDNELPPYIYRMRVFGYPPGWLEEANCKADALALYDKDGNETNLAEENYEGRCSSSGAGVCSPGQLDMNKIIEYPGFTVEIPHDVVDISSELGMPQIQKHQLKKTLVEGVKKAYKKRSLDNGDDEAENKKQRTVRADKVEEKATPGMGNIADDDGGLKDGEPVSVLVTDEDPSVQVTMEDDIDISVANSVTPRGSEPEGGGLGGRPSTKNFSFTSSSSMSRDFGTPILMRASSYQELPSADKFAHGAEEHIPYENLPNSVGTFSRIRSLFTSLRDKVKSYTK